ncbi:replication initiation factor domain-containing protein [Streptococcus suis]|uniref:Replication protein n=1 Tax=Streptococcus suis TaxID=1307 RepID=A0ACD4UKI2_STRSU
MEKKNVQEFENTKKRGKNEGKNLLVNEWEKLAALSNRRLNVQTLVQGVKMGWSIDRITIVGKLRNYVWLRDGLEPVSLDFDMVWMIFEEQGIAEKVGEGWILKDKYGENIAYAEKLKFDKTKGRIDFNPNTIKPFLHGSLKNFIHDIFDEPHFSRADVACDMIDVPDDFIRQYRIVEPVSFKPIYGTSGELETAYWGSRSSERQVRLYNKKLEQTKKKKVVPKEVETWWRLEVQLRRSKASEWNAVVSESLDNFSSQNYLPSNMKVTDKAMIIALMTEHGLWGELSRNTKYKYRKILKEIAENDELTQHLKSSFSESARELKNELDSWLIGLDVSE